MQFTSAELSLDLKPLVNKGVLIEAILPDWLVWLYVSARQIPRLPCRDAGLKHHLVGTMLKMKRIWIDACLLC